MQIESHLLSKSGGFGNAMHIKSPKLPRKTGLKAENVIVKEDDEENMNLLTSRDTEINSESNSFIEKDSIEIYDISEISQERVGYLLPLACGH